LFLLVLLILLYGKSFGSVLGAYLLGSKNLEFGDPPSFENIMMNFGHLFYSIDVGIVNFLNSGPFIAKDILLSPIGLVPSAVFNFFDLSDLSYQLLPKDSRSACINTELLGVSGECYVPPYFTGISAYIMPLIGGLFFGFIRFLIYSSISKSWRKLEYELKEFKYLPVVLLIYLFLDQVMLFIPNAISSVIFLSLIILFFRFLFIVSKRS
jgi:hypothetical protein